MTDYAELKRLAEAAIVALDEYNADECNYELAEAFGAADDAFHDATGPATVLALIAENERLERKNANQSESIREYQDLVMGGDVSLGMLKADIRVTTGERDQLRAEIAGLRTGYEAYERVNAELKAEVVSLKDEISIDDKIIAERDRLLNLFECPDHGQCVPYAMEQVAALRKDAERYRWLRDSDYAGKILRDMGAKYRADADQRIDAALGQGEQS